MNEKKFLYLRNGSCQKAHLQVLNFKDSPTVGLSMNFVI